MDKSCGNCLHFQLYPQATTYGICKVTEQGTRSVKKKCPIKSFEALDSIIKVEHPNGYTGVLYGKSSMSIKDQEGREVLHTGSRNINTEAELYQHLEEFPEFMKMLAANWDRLTKEDEDTDI